MKTNHPQRNASGLTLIELTVVILVLITMVGLGLHFSSGMSEWKHGKDAGEKLRTVYAAQKSYLADNPTVTISALSATEAASRIVPYLPTGETSLPTVKSKDGKSTYSIRANVSPPVVDSGGGTYDPSGSSSDGLWDVGL